MTTLQLKSPAQGNGVKKIMKRSQKKPGESPLKGEEIIRGGSKRERKNREEGRRTVHWTER